MTLTRTTNQHQSRYTDEQGNVIAVCDRHAQGRLPSGIIRIKLPDGKSVTHVISGVPPDVDSIENCLRMVHEIQFNLVIPHGKSKEQGIPRSEFTKMTKEQKHKWLKSG